MALLYVGRQTGGQKLNMAVMDTVREDETDRHREIERDDPEQLLSHN